MYVEKTPPSKRFIVTLCLSITAVVILAGVGLWAVLSRATSAMDEQAAISVKSAVTTKAVQCYAVEGVYPPNLSYLEENYGLQINHKKFIVTYKAFASNMMPEVMVLEK